MLVYICSNKTPLMTIGTTDPTHRNNQPCDGDGCHNVLVFLMVNYLLFKIVIIKGKPISSQDLTLLLM